MLHALDMQFRRLQRYELDYLSRKVRQKMARERSGDKDRDSRDTGTADDLSDRRPIAPGSPRPALGKLPSTQEGEGEGQPPGTPVGPGKSGGG